MIRHVFSRLGLQPATRADAKTALSKTLFIKFFVSGLILLVLLWWLPVQELLAGIGRVPAVLWCQVVILFLLIHSVAALKWRYLLGVVNAQVPAILAIRAHAAGLFANLCLPSIVGGDVVRAAMLSRHGPPLETIAVASLVDRMIDTLALVTIAAMGAWTLAHSPTQVSVAQGNLLGVLAIALLVMIGTGIAAVFVLPAHRLPAKLEKLLTSVQTSMVLLIKKPLSGVLALLLSILLQLSLIGLNIMLAGALGLSLHWALWCFAWPMAKLISLVPVSVGGIGVRDAALLGLLAPYAGLPALVLAQSLSWQLVLIIAGLLAGLLAAFVPGNVVPHTNANTQNGLTK